MRTRLALLAGILTAALAAAVWRAAESVPEPGPTGASAESAGTPAMFGLVAPVRATPRRAVSAPLLRLQLVDKVSGRPLAGARVAVQDGGAATAGEAGAVEVKLLPAHRGRAAVDLVVEVPVTTPPLRFARSVSAPAQRDAVQRIELPVFARVAVTLRGQQEVRVEGQVHVEPRSPVALPPQLDQSAVRRLRLASYHRGTQRRQRERAGLSSAPVARVGFARAPWGAPPVVHVDVPHRGVADLHLTGDLRGPTALAEIRNEVVQVDLRPGHVTRATCELRAKPVVRGRVLGCDGVPRAGVRVTVAARAAFHRGELVPHDDEAPGAAAMFLFRRMGDPSVTSLLQDSTRTDADGYFALPLSFSARVAAWVHLSAEAGQPTVMAYAERAARTRFDDVEGLVLRCREAPTGAESSVRLVEPAGAPLREVPVRLLCVDDAFQCHPPAASTDSRGVLSLAHVRSGARYRITFLRGDYQDCMLVPGRREQPVERVAAAPRPE